MRIVKDEIDILYAISNELTQAATPGEWLEAVSGYARESGATTGALFWISADGEWLEIGAEWATGQGQYSGVGTRFKVSEYRGFVRAWTSTPDRPTLIPDATTSDRLDPASRGLLARNHMRAAAILPLNSKGRWVGALMFTWHDPFLFDERDQRIFTAILQQAAPIIDSVRLDQQSRDRASRAEQLLRVNTALSQSKNEQEMVTAVALYAEQQRPLSLTLSYLETDERGYPVATTSVGQWEPGRIQPGDPGLDQTFRLDDYGLSRLWIDGPDTALLIEDCLADPRVDEHTRSTMEQSGIRAIAIFPLHSGGRWQGLLTVQWSEPHAYSEEERQVYAGLMQSLPSVVASRRAYLAELEACQESGFLYRASKAVNAANSLEDIAQAVAQLNWRALDVMLSIWENYDFETATYLEVIATADDSTVLPRTRLPVSALPRTNTRPRRGLIVVEDTADRPPIDPMMPAPMDGQRYQALIGVHLSLNNRWLGALTFESSEPRLFTPLERRLVAGIGDLVTAALERIRLREETEAAMRRAETLAHVNAALSQATDEQSTLDAVTLLIEQFDAALSMLAYATEPDSLNVVAVRLGNGSAPTPESLLPEITFRLENWPLFQPNPEEPIFVENRSTDPRVESGDARRFLPGLTWQAAILIPLKIGDQWQGLLSFAWDEPRTFTPEARRLFTAIRPTAASVVATRRAYLAEETAHRESEFLYKASECINAATSFAEIVRAVAQLNITSDRVVLGVFQNFSADGALYIQLYTSADNSSSGGGRRVVVFDAPCYYWMSRDSLLVVDDVATCSQFDRKTAATLQGRGYQAFVNVALRLGNRWLGNLTFESERPRSYAAQDTRLIEGIGELVTAALERIRLQAETESARQRAELLAGVNAALSQATDEQAILAAVATIAAQFGAAFSYLTYIVETDEQQRPAFEDVVAMQLWSGDGSALALNILPGNPLRTEDHPLLRLVYENPDEPLFIENVLTDARNGAALPMPPRNWSAAIAIPLKTGHEWQGILSFFWKDPQGFSEDTRALFTAIRPAAASVVTSRRAYLAEEEARRETELRARELETVAKVSAAATTILDVDELLSTVSELTRSNFSLEYAHFYLLDEEEGCLALSSAPGAKITLSDERSLVVRAACSREGIIGAVLPTEMVSEMAVPMVVGEKLIGVLDVQSRHPARFTDGHLQVMATLADLIAVTIQNARHYAQAQELAALEERNRLARELHDSVSQALYGIALGARTARALLDRDPGQVREPLEYVLSLAEAGLTEMRALIFELRPESLENEGLITALSRQATSIQARHGINVVTDLGDEPTISLQTKEALYRIAREALHNTVKHARATQVMLRLGCEQDRVTLEVRDDGVSFDPGGDFPGHLGLQSMRERAANLGGTVEIEGAPGTGTRITVSIPL